MPGLADAEQRRALAAEIDAIEAAAGPLAAAITAQVRTIIDGA